MDEDKDIIENEEAGEQLPKKRKPRDWLAPYMFQPGKSGNPSGRPKGPSMKEWVKLRLASMTDEERLDYLKGINKIEIWKMGEGAPEAKTDITSKGESIVADPRAVELAKKYEEELKKDL